jgi:hypothetical protein
VGRETLVQTCINQKPRCHPEAAESRASAQEIDFLVAHIVPLDVWYVVPVEAIAAGTSLRLYPDYDCKQARFEQYKEAWHLFGSEAGAVNEPVVSGDPMAGVEKEEPVVEPLIKWNPVWKPWIFRGR